jgi:excisionase family DNA binding protein
VSSVAASPEWLDLRSLRKHACVSDRTLRSWINRPTNPLPAVRVGGKLLVARTDFDRWLRAHRISRSAVNVSKIVDDVVKELLG